MDKPKPGPAARFKLLAVAMTVPFLLVGGVVAGYVVGAWIDNRWNTDPYGKAIVMTLGVLAAGIEIYRMIKAAAA